jgi:hypothetical protein
MRVMTMEEAEKVAKLPVWAKRLVDRLVMKLESATEELTDLKNNTYGEEDTDTVAQPFHDIPLLLRKGETIEFRMGDKWHEVIRVRVTNEGLNINGDRGISIEPKASNSVMVNLV